MKMPTQFPKVVKDMFFVQMSWALWFLGFLLIVNVVKMARAFFQDGTTDHYFAAVFIPANLFMVVIGIISVFFLPHYVSLGVTRKVYFKGTLIAAIGISAVIPILTIGIYVLQQWIVHSFTTFSFKVTDLNSILLEIDSHVVAELVQSIILSPYVDPGSNGGLAVIVFGLNMLIYY
ncbi:hypothetical protein [Paenibacillus senegalensis]|uniref:hypothetical protein n=1 Tax=Paenibacillus senegalensis TaxID=1465766 RepID=UPI000289D60E|nr:hypothetical protein [Paenibacillus senegalensis]